ncbi:uncharacterized protein LOC141863159 [Acropora palmata]|uniref:uncharacterized protein LOC141863159 n=1 Tax=Acropora palmata TaxID=6131 RepID=UPI003DA036C1
MPPNTKNYKGRSPNVLRYIESCGNEEDIGSLLCSNLAAGARLAAENESQAHDEKTSRTYELRLMSLERFAQQNGDDAVLFGANKRPFLAATIQTYMQMLSETKGKRLGSLSCRGLKPPVVRGHAAAFTYWFNVFGHSGPYSQSIEVLPDGSQKVIAKGNPMNSPANSGRVPQRIEVKIPWSKADKKAKGVTLSLWANSLKRELCPVTALFTWLLITGIKKGQNYIFPRVAKNNRAVLPNCARRVTTYRKTFLETSNILFGKDFTTHSIRRSAARWAARCGANDSSIKRAGRWKSNSFELYTQDARAEMIKEHHDGQPVSDHKIWMFKPLR